MLNNQEYITTELRKILYNILPISSNKLKNLVYIIVGIVLSKSVILSEISEKLKDDYTEAGEASKSFKHIKQGIKELNDIFASYNYEVILLADRGFKSIDLFRFIDGLGWKYCSIQFWVCLVVHI